MSKKAQLLIGTIMASGILVAVVMTYHGSFKSIPATITPPVRQIPSWNLVNPADTYTFTTAGSEAFITCGPPPIGMRMSTLQEATTQPLAKIYEYNTASPTNQASYPESNRLLSGTQRWGGRHAGYTPRGQDIPTDTLTQLSAGRRYYIKADQPTGFWCWQRGGGGASSSAIQGSPQDFFLALGGQIVRFSIHDLSQSAVPVDIRDIIGSIHHVAYDQTNGKLYFADDASIKIADLDGTNVQTIRAENNVEDMTVDKATGELWYLLLEPIGNTNQLKLRRTNDSQIISVAYNGNTAYVYIYYASLAAYNGTVSVRYQLDHRDDGSTQVIEWDNQNHLMTCDVFHNCYTFPPYRAGVGFDRRGYIFFTTTISNYTLQEGVMCRNDFDPTAVHCSTYYGSSPVILLSVNNEGNMLIKDGNHYKIIDSMGNIIVQ